MKANNYDLERNCEERTKNLTNIAIMILRGEVLAQIYLFVQSQQGWVLLHKFMKVEV